MPAVSHCHGINQWANSTSCFHTFWCLKWRFVESGDQLASQILSTDISVDLMQWSDNTNTSYMTARSLTTVLKSLLLMRDNPSSNQLMLLAYRLCWCPSAWRSSLSSSQVSTHPQASSSQKRPSYRSPAWGTHVKSETNTVHWRSAKPTNVDISTH